MSSQTQENYLKCIYQICEQNLEGASTNAIAEKLDTKPATVSDMLKKLASKKLINYQKYQRARLTPKGKKAALGILRNHRLWEVFLVDKLAFRWDEVHELAEQLEHVQSEALIERLDKFLGLPKFDPHGDPIPNKHGKIIQNNHISLSNAAIGKKLVISGVLEHSDQFLSHLNHTNLVLGQKIVIKSVNDFDQSMQVSIHKKEAFFISHQVAKNILVTCQ